MIVFHVHIDDPLSEVQVLVHLMQAVIHCDLVVLIQHGFYVCPRKLTVYYVAEDDGAVSTCTGDNSAVVRPREFHKGTGCGFVEGVGPTGFITESEHFKRTDCEVITVGCPLYTSDNVVISRGTVELTPVLVPHTVLTVLTTGDNDVIAWVPIYT